MYFIIKCPYCKTQAIEPEALSSKARHPKSCCCELCTGVRAENYECKKCKGLFAFASSYPKELIVVHDRNNTYQASYGKVKACATAGSQQAANAVARKVLLDGHARFICTQNKVDYYSLEKVTGEIA